MPERVQAFADTGQPVPETVGQIMRDLREPMCGRYAQPFVAIGSGRWMLYIIGGGSRNALLCQMTAD